MIDLTAHILAAAPDLDAVFRAGVDAALAGIRPRADYRVMATVRARHGFAEREAPLLSFDNIKLLGASVPSYGLTLFHHRSKLAATADAPALSLNACPWAGHCTRVCVLNNGHGRWDSTKRAWRWRTDLLARHPHSFARILAWELVRGVAKHGGAILFRPNVNSDALWHLLLPSLCNGYVAGVTSYGYSKWAGVLESDGWLGSHYRVSFSWNERDDADPTAVAAFLARGGSVAVVTARRKRAPILSLGDLPFAASIVVDADKSDEWMFARGTVGDLSAKGQARKLIGKSAFVVGAPAPAPVKVTLRRAA
jgi:hypothetical protein